MGTATDVGTVVEQFNVNLKPLEAALEKGDIRTGVDIDRLGAWKKYLSDTYLLRVGLTRTTGQVVFTVEKRDRRPLGEVNLTITGKKGSYTCSLNSGTDSVWLDHSSSLDPFTGRVGSGPYTVVVKPA